jgi:diacylglycerol O-acyltransferase/trehalose O-mycolyltransferase
MARALRLLLAGALAAALAGCSSAEPAADGGGHQGAGPFQVLSDRKFGGRGHDLLVRSPSLPSPVTVRVLLPDRFEAEPERRWPVLYLLHGCCDDYRSWTRDTDVEALTSGTDLLVVMPDGGQDGFYSDWYNDGQGGPPAWETFHLTELRELLESRYRAGDRRAIAGLSMGGFGALAYAARHPGMFRFAASFSGVVNTRSSSGQETVRQVAANAGDDPGRIWGDIGAQSRVWAEHNPYDLAERLRGVELMVTSGTGALGPLDDPDDTPQIARDIEASLSPQNIDLRERLRQLGIPATFDIGRPGTHTWPYWQRALHAAMPKLLAALEG